jgi:hypothetical protein
MNEKPSDQFKAIPKEAPKPEVSQSGALVDLRGRHPGQHPPGDLVGIGFGRRNRSRGEPGKAEGRRLAAGGPTGPEPTRYGDWERNGRVSDF